ncbi:hypothetical protein GCM10022252_75170 [Streptosporangium oxazolinicum]|uniref:Uncharacterized protein n=1 Tax=Streptosporangium oxazolinicum TaxID=909287 RepID=A0ABP8BL41_9ACTN
MPDTPTSPPPRKLTSYGPLQLARRLDLTEWQVARAVAAGLLPPADQATRRWPAAVVEDAATRREAIVAGAGAIPDVGAHRAAEALTERFDDLEVTVTANAVVELHRRGLLPQALDEDGNPAEYKDHVLYCGRALEAFEDRTALLRAIVDGEMHTADEAAKQLLIRRTDFDHLVRAGRIEPKGWGRGPYQRRRDVPEVPLYRTGDLHALASDRGIDWEAVRATPAGRPSLLAALPSVSAEVDS